MADDQLVYTRPHIWNANVYHSTTTCHSFQNIDGPRELSESDAERYGLRECRICRGEVPDHSANEHVCAKLRNGTIDV